MHDHDARDTVTEIEGILSLSAPPDAVLRDVCQVLATRHEGYDWVGFYVVDPSDPRCLVLGPFVGAPTEHTRIPFGRGVCGQAAETGRPLLVDDVSAEDNYLACSLLVRSEIVVPVWSGEGIIGELDLDSHAAGRFSGRDEALLTDICRRVASVVEAYRDAMRPDTPCRVPPSA